MRKSIKKITAVVSAAILGALPIAGSFTANAASLPDDKVKFIFGDINNDGKITNTDAKLVAQIVAEKTSRGFSQEQIRRADVNGDGFVTSADTTMIITFASRFASNPKKVYGDADNSGKVTLYDAAYVEEYVKYGSHRGSINLMAADVNADGVVNSFDFELINAFRVSNKLSTLLINWGDVNSDGRITIDDYRKIKNLAAENTSVQFTSAELRRADINLDGYVDNTDADWLMHYISYNHFDWLS